MLPDGSRQGGSAIKMRLGDGATRFTTDLDIARASAIDDFSEQLAGSLAAGWEGFTALWSRRGRHIPKVFPRNM